MTFPELEADAEIDDIVNQAMLALAQMIGEALRPYGIGKSVALGADKVDVSPGQGPFVLHQLVSNGAWAIEVVSECEVRVSWQVHSWYLTHPTQADTQARISAVARWIIPIVRAMVIHESLGNLVEQCWPVSWSPFSSGTWGKTQYSGVLVTSKVSVLISTQVLD